MTDLVVRVSRDLAKVAYCKRYDINPAEEVVFNTDHFERWYVDNRNGCRNAARCAIQATGVEELVGALEKAERQLVELYRVCTPHGNYGSNAVGSSGNQNTFADKDDAVIGARTALAKFRAGGEG
jgi:hypothetical protein